nr:MAG TPA: hypothetical protein [Caudoviricetes sp.]
MVQVQDICLKNKGDIVMKDMLIQFLVSWLVLFGMLIVLKLLGVMP